MYVRPISTRFSRGMLTPAIRAIDRFLSLSLSLLVSGVRADDQHVAVPADDAALLTHRTDARTNFHRRLPRACGGRRACRCAPREQRGSLSSAPRATLRLSQREDARAVAGDRHGVLAVRGEAAVARVHGPA